MVLIKCSECESDISDKAQSCPKCGNPLKDKKDNDVSDKTQTVQLTGKKWKIVKLISVVLFILGWMIFFPAFEKNGFRNPMSGLGFSLGMLGLFIWFVAKIGSWWNHK
ncbi:MAG: hypothetical protein Q8P20_08190 [bacterium]|nr:hypothetical protein [bacterium]